MNLQKINESIARYKEIIKDEHYDGWRLWELAAQFQKNWDIDAPDFGSMFSESFGINSPLWNRDHYYPKKAMERYINFNDDIVRSMFKDLLNESKDIDGRIGRFIFQCDELYKIERQANQKVLPHDHGDKHMIFIYLCFAYPESYALHDFPSFKSYLSYIGSTKPVQESDIIRFTKVCKTLSTLMLKDDELMSIIQENVGEMTGGELYPMLGVYELYGLTNQG